MEDDGNEQKEQPKAAKVPEKAGWIKKSSGKILGTYKDRYIQLERTEILVYDNEDLKNCMEKVDLENYDKCHELRSAFKKRNRLILIRAPKSGSKVHDIKLQTQSPEEKEAWIKALSDGINRAKNKVFDEIKVDESCSLEHVTRSRPKGNHGRRPPTRIHMKEVASVASDGILRLDLDAVDNTPNGNHPVFTDANDINEVGKPTSSGEPTPQKKVLKPPMPPSKENKLSVLTEKEELKEVSPDGDSTDPLAPTAPPDKLSITPEEDGSAQTPAPPSPPAKDLKPPMPPSKDKKPAPPADKEGSEDSLAADNTDQGGEEAEDVSPTSPPDEVLQPQEIKTSPPVTELQESAETPPAQDASCPPTPSPEEQVAAPSPSEVETEATPAAGSSAEMETLKPSSPPPKPKSLSPEPIIKNSAPPAPPKKKPLKPLIKTTASDQPSDTGEASGVVWLAEAKQKSPPEDSATATQPDASESLKPSQPKEDGPLSQESNSENLDLKSMRKSPEPSNPAAGEQEDVKSDNSTHSSQSGDESESDNMRASTTALSGSRENLSEDSGDEDKATQRLEEEPRTTEKAKETCFQDADKVASVQQLVQSKRIMQPSPPPVPLKLISKEKFASTGDLLSESAQQSSRETMRELNVSSLNTDMNKLKNQVSLELEKTEELLQKLDEKKTAKGSQGNLPDGLVPEDPSAEEILNEAVEKLRKADEFLKEVQNLKESNSTGKKSKRKSW
nr:PREDICTED: pleckstrin homology domain-containing family O member 2 [Lepisosteus oculatus]